MDHSGHPGATFTVILGRSAPSAGVLLPIGEFLLAGTNFFTNTVGSAGTFDTHTIMLPLIPAFAGLPTFTQAAIVGGAGPELCNAIDVIIGF